MTALTISGAVLTADTAARIIRGRLLPYGEEGRTSMGRVTASRGAVTIPDNPADVVLNLAHDRDRPAGRAANITETDDGLDAAFTVARVPAGDQLLAEASEGLRAGLSVELEDVVIRDGVLLSGRLTDVGVVVRPAFPSALLVAADAGELEEAVTTTDDEATADVSVTPNDDGTVTTAVTVTTTPEGTEPEDDDDDETETDVAATASAPSDLRAGAARRGGANLQGRTGPPTAHDAFGLIAAAFTAGDGMALTAALADVTIGSASTGIYSRTTQPAWLGELWSGRAFSRKFVPLLNHGTLTGMKVAGWRWVNKPVMADYAGNKAAVPSNAVSVEPADALAQRVAGAWDIDRAYFDFGDAGFIESFLRAMTESYARISDAKAAGVLVAAATANPTTPGPVPPDVSPAMAAIVDGALAVLSESLPAYALVANDLYRDVLLTRSDDTLAYLNASLGLEDGTVGSFRILPAGDALEAGQVVVGAREAVTFYELGETPIRVEAENIPNGGRDIGVFGYWSSIVNDADAITLVDTAPAP